ncbi:hypothetical protein [Iningainema tapete]|uniref:Uncharacterized protein n=1 Tax=Iningainema tapete BLCC-T55 TaxID=2748662 RepID=A0A8J6XM60_9CYAN|nr:hypothetical protein [Iningainema tapete]MBD2774259.1 hypothetical protein [Iningainema tapete BLCC-T55]
MKSKSIFISLLTTVFIVSLGTVSYGQETSNLLEKGNKITQNSNNPNSLSIITEGFEALCSGSSKNAYTIWANHSSPMISTTITQTANDIDKMFNFMLGKCINYSVIATVSITEKTQIVYVQSEHDKAAFFWEFIVYKGTNGWLISSFDSNTDPTDIVPNSILFKGKNSI